MTDEQQKALRKPFPKESVGKIPRRGIELDYVGHAAVTDRLLSVDPSWDWKPLARDEYGLPKTDRAGNLWIELTICGVTRIGVGDGHSAKECVGDAIRNAAMRFGVALDLWTKDELESIVEGSVAPNIKPTATPPRKPVVELTPFQIIKEELREMMQGRYDPTSIRDKLASIKTMEQAEAAKAKLESIISKEVKL